ncbi:Zn-ribbon domain-containing OB-fold protein [Nocardioides houyundeii]|uniref:Zn-ribbon domain-containing OB-fold protein n=1 Tax=Nocardioides houyundeii TaxID=2045452 RepID=UPI0013B404D5|nr:OB-fold domain-containing protein [Nocardioides houyundeii]
MDAGRSPDARYREYLDEGLLHFQRCGEGHAVFPPRLVCPACGGRDLDWRPSVGTGVVYSATTTPVRDGEEYSIVLVDMDDGFRMMSRMDRVSPQIGDQVRVVVRPIPGGTEPLPCVEPDHAATGRD